ncbi:putative receptor protein kinase ZmPK1 [Coffea eugenioides]|uniref:putative receptor protein kinase ZmPK1 n=1 Tax=Coffea eugenioides TaxID=49369 RepID=UPI000F61280E|nr:putative receptor protein kinase ZmPK1 [Coffea eugenioides]XP_027154452.1 putative receptor protein kinase ZmPK1 [Coffea eugenioides]
MANRNQPVNGKHSGLSLQDSGNLLLTDAGQFSVWTSNTKSNSSVQLKLQDNGNLVLSTSDGEFLWQSFDFPTNTLLPGQLFTSETILVSSRSTTNYSSGFYKLYFDSDSVLHLRYEGPEITTVYWPDPWLNIWDAGRSSFNGSKIAVLDESGYFQSSDLLQFYTSDHGIGPLRRLVLDVDGSLRVHSLDKANGSWRVTWVHNSEPCKIHGICGTNSLCIYDPEAGRKCTCIPGYRMINQTDWSYGCEPDFQVSCTNESASGFIQLLHVEYYGYDIGYFPNSSLESCKSLCLNYCECKGFQYKFDLTMGYYSCYLKTILFNGYRSQNYQDPIYIRLPALNGKHRLLVYEYMEHGSLAKNLYSDKLDWKKKYEIALGTAKGLAYLHEECLEWVLHCDVKPQNILLNSDYQPKVADFGLSKLLNRSAIDNSMFSKIRGTRGYMAPEWVFNLPITSKVDVYSYGIVVLEMITGRRSTGNHANDESIVVEPRRLVTWVKENIKGTAERASEIKDIVDPTIKGDFDMGRMGILIDVALKCAEEDKDARPTMRQAVDMLLHQDCNE